MELNIHGSTVVLHGADAETAEALDDAFKYEVKGASYSKLYTGGKWDGYKHMYSVKTGKFAIGLLNRALVMLRLLGHDPDIIDYRITDEPEPFSTEIILRPYQVPIVEGALEIPGQLICLPVGSGKTVIMIEILARRGLPTIILVPNTDLVDQTIDAMVKFARVDPARVSADWLCNPDRPWSKPYWAVGTWQSFNAALNRTKMKSKPKEKEGQTFEQHEKKLKKWREHNQLTNVFKPIVGQILGKYDVLIFDEAHHAGSEKVHEICMNLPARYRYGFSATPFRTSGDQLRMNASLGDNIGGISTSELIELGWLVPAHIKFHDMPGRKLTSYSDHHVVYTEGVVENLRRNEALCKGAAEFVDAGRSTLFFCDRIAHGEILQSYLKDQHGLEVPFVHGKVAKRKKIREGFAAGDIPLAISSSIWFQGIDFPIVSAIVMGGPHKSAIISRQIVGRGLRPYCFDCKGRVPWPCGHGDLKTECKVFETTDNLPFLRQWTYARFDEYNREAAFAIS